MTGVFVSNPRGGAGDDRPPGRPRGAAESA